MTLAQQWDAVFRLTGQTLTAAVPGRAGLARPPDAAATRALQRRAYRYRRDGHLTGAADLLGGARRFNLDPAGRVAGVTGDGWAERYGYDPAGNVTAASWPVPPQRSPGTMLDTDVQGPRAYTGTLITRCGGTRYRYDRQGRVISRQRIRLSRRPETWHYSWDAEDRLIAVTTPAGARWRYLYDPLGRRIAKQRHTTDGAVAEQTSFSWDGATLAEQVTTGSGAAGPVAVPRGAADPVSMAVPQSVITWDYQPGTCIPVTQTERLLLGGPPQQQIDERFYAIVTDLIGSPSELVTPDGILAGYQQHTLWGATLWKPGGASSPLRFPGQYADPETCLHYNFERYYDPACKMGCPMKPGLREVLTIIHGGNIVPGLSFYGLLSAGDELRTSFPANLWPASTEYATSWLHGDAWCVIIWDVALLEWPLGERFKSAVKATLKTLLDGGSVVAWIGLEGCFCDPPDLLSASCMSGCVLAAALPDGR